ncbi:MAG: hypothetical protein ABT25_26780 [Variovorax sp. SCN 67-20]|nr:MAG: hypothetical protein ABT25_26780 [Variovorax sp. SCN 67-20]
MWGLESAGMRIPTATIVQSSAATSRLRGGLGFDVSPERPMAERVVPAAVSLSQPRIGVLEGALEEPMAVEGAPPDVPADALALREALQPVRLHEETTVHGQAIWVAMHADEATLAAVLPGIVSDLRNGLHAQGRRLYQVVCNGRLIWREEAPAAPGELSAADRGATAHGDVGMFDSILSKEA